MGLILSFYYIFYFFCFNVPVSPFITFLLFVNLFILFPSFYFAHDIFLTILVIIQIKLSVNHTFFPLLIMETAFVILSSFLLLSCALIPIRSGCYCFFFLSVFMYIYLSCFSPNLFFIVKFI